MASTTPTEIVFNYDNPEFVGRTSAQDHQYAIIIGLLNTELYLIIVPRDLRHNTASRPYHHFLSPDFSILFLTILHLKQSYSEPSKNFDGPSGEDRLPTR